MSPIQHPPTNLEKLKIYVCYRGKEKRIARDLAQELRETECVDTFFDENNLPAGANLPEKLAQEIQDSDYFLAVVSKDMLDSSWVQLEIDEALRKLHSIRREFIIPVLLPQVDPERLPEFLKNIHNLELLKDEKAQIKVLGDDLAKLLFRTVGMHFRGKSKSQASIAPETKDWQTTTRRLADLDFPSLQSFYHTCKNAERGTFFNVQISSDEWFAPNLQIHLAIQEGMAQHIRWASDPPTDGGVTNRHMPFRRVSFLASTRAQLLADLETAKPSAKHLCALMHIHNLMACPLAIVTVDAFAKIIVENFDFFVRPDVERVLGIPNAIVQIANANNRRNGWFIDLRDKLLSQVRRQACDTPGVVEPSVDFAIFRHQKPGADSISIWGGKVASDGALVYFEIPTNAEQQREKQVVLPKLDGITFTTNASQNETHSCLLEFSKIVETYVFRDRGDNDSEVLLNTRERDYVKAFFDLNPVASILGIETPPDINQLTKVSRGFCPWMLLHDFSESPGGKFQDGIKSVRQEHRI